MKVRTLSVICLLACLAIAVPMLSQGKGAAAADPVSGSWSGDWGPNERDRNQVTLDLKFDAATKAVTGTVKSTQPARADVALTKASYDAATQKVTMEAEARNPRSGQTVKYVIEGTMAGTSMSGSWSHDAVKGDFKLTKK
jgi:hypothetical protein